MPDYQGDLDRFLDSWEQIQRDAQADQRIEELARRRGLTGAEVRAALDSIDRGYRQLRSPKRPTQAETVELAMKTSELTVAATFRSTADAHVAKGVLDELAIESMIRSDNAGGMYPALSGADLLVRTEDVQKAKEALNVKHQQSE